MKTAKLRSHIILWAIMLLPLIYLGIIWNNLPETVPMHYGLDGQPDRWGSKTSLIYLAGLLPIGIYLLMMIIPALDPKKKIQQMGKTYDTLLMIMVAFMSGLALFILFVINGNSDLLLPVLPALIGILLAILGNYLQAVKPNYFLGIRTPWTLESESVWRKTHRLGGRLFMAGGIVMTVISFFLKGQALFIPYIGIVLIISLIPIVYSYLLFKNQRQEEHN